MILYHWLTAFLSGAGVLVVEMTAARALAPYFGQAQFVWANVIGLILLALAIGNQVGGRIADRTVNPAVLGGLLVAAAGLVAASAFLPGPVARALLPEALPLEAAFPYLFQGSFVATLVCFGPPVVLLGAVPPFLVRCGTRRIEEVGRTSGLLYAASTLGSIAGTFVTSYVLLARCGTRGTLLLAAGLLLVSAVPAFLSARLGAGRAALLAAVGLVPAAVPLAGWPEWAVRVQPGAAHGRFVTAVESRYQHLEIRERSDLPVRARVLAIDEGHDSVQSVTPLEGVLTGLYYDSFTLLALDLARAARLRVAILGFGAGTHARQLLHYVGPRTDLSIVGVELDPEAVRLGREELDLPDDPRLEVIVDLDARTFADHARDEYDLIVVDCYGRQSFVPSHVASREFFEATRRRLAGNGVVALNLFGYGASDPVVEAIVDTLAAVMGEDVIVCAVPSTANFLVYAARDGAPRLPSEWETSSWPEECKALAAELAAMGQAFRHERRAAETVLTDDAGILERLQEERLRRRANALLGQLPGD